MRIVPACSFLFSTLLVLACNDAEAEGSDGSDSGAATSDGGSDDGKDDGASDDGETGSGGGGSDGTGDGSDDTGASSAGTSDSSETSSTTGSTATTSSATGTSTTDTSTATSSAGSTGTTTTSTTGGTATTDTGTTTTDTGTTTTGTTTTSGQASVEYVAFAMFGGLDRIFIRKADHDGDLCLSLVVVWPGGMPLPFPDVTTPTQWAVETIAVSQGTTGCTDLCTGPGTPGEYADTATGYVDFVFNQPGQFPETLDIDVTMTFPQGQPWVPAADTMDALDLSVGSCQ